MIKSWYPRFGKNIILSAARCLIEYPFAHLILNTTGFLFKKTKQTLEIIKHRG